LIFYKEFRALRKYAGQNNPSNQTINPKWLKGVIAMAKKMLIRLKPFTTASLVLIGWVSFILGNSLNDSPEIITLILLSIARVLP